MKYKPKKAVRARTLGSQHLTALHKKRISQALKRHAAHPKKPAKPAKIKKIATAKHRRITRIYV